MGAAFQACLKAVQSLDSVIHIHIHISHIHVSQYVLARQTINAETGHA